MKKLSVLLFVLIFSFSNISIAQESEGLEIEGIGQMYVAPDIAIFNFNLEETNLEFNKSVDQLHSKINKLNKILKKKGIDKSKITATNYRITKEFKHDYKKKTKEFIGYKSSFDIRVESSSDAKEINSIFKSISSEFSDIELRFHFSSSDENYKEEVLKLAIEDAKQKAQIISSASGVQLGKIRSIKYISNKAINTPRAEMSMNKAVLNDYVPVDDFNPAKILKTTSILILWQLY